MRKRLSGFPLHFAACNPHIAERVFAADGTERVNFRTLIRISDYISVHVPLNEQTYHLFDKSVFATMKNDAILINTSRGSIVDTQALYNALKEGEIAGAALDVYDSEPFHTSHPLGILNHVILSDHAAWYSEESQKELQMRTALEAARVLTGGLPENPVNPEVLQRKLQRKDIYRSCVEKRLSGIQGQEKKQLEKVI